MQQREFRVRAKKAHANFPLGFILLAVGGALLARELGVTFPKWFFSWEMLLITIGLIVGIVNRFRDFGWLIMIGIGLVFLVDDLYPTFSHFIWPAAIILVGLIIIFKPVREKKTIIIPQTPYVGGPTAGTPPVDIPMSDATPTKGDVLDVTSVFGGTKKIVLSKNFKGGEMVCIFGGADINLTQADFPHPVTVEVVCIFGGAKLIVPANWEIRSETAAIMGAIDDKRDPVAMTNPEKILILDGVVIFGGIEISSY